MIWVRGRRLWGFGRLQFVSGVSDAQQVGTMLDVRDSNGGI